MESFLGVLGISKKTRDFEILILGFLKTFSNYVNMKKIHREIFIFHNKTIKNPPPSLE